MDLYSSLALANGLCDGQIGGGLLCQSDARTAGWTTFKHACGVRGDYLSLIQISTGLTRLNSHIEVTPEHHGNLFFWHFENRHIANRKRTVIWLNGGPGCSSMDGALMEIGPYRLKDKDHLVYNEGSWDEFANLLFIDNPVGTGFSYVDTDSYVHELKDMADQLIVFLEKYFAIFPEHEDNDVSYQVGRLVVSLIDMPDISQW